MQYTARMKHLASFSRPLAQLLLLAVQKTMVLAEYSSSYSVYLSYAYMMLATYILNFLEQFQTIVQLAHACPTMSCIHLV